MRNAFAVITYDVAKNKERHKLHKFLKEYGVCVQKSVFECEVDDRSLLAIQRHAEEILDPKTDSLRAYHICGECVGRIETVGQCGLLITQGYMLV